jgi:protein SCO1/2
VLQLPVPATVEGLPLVDQDGKVVTLASLRGRTVVVTPNLTLCQEICPLISADIGVAERAVGTSPLAGKVVFVEVTVDPGRDDVAHLKAYQAQFGTRPDWLFLRGTDAQIASFWNAFHLGYGKVANDPGDHPHDWLTGAPMTYDVQHQNVLYVLGTGGQIDWLTEAAPNAVGTTLPDKLNAFLSAQGVANHADPAGPSWTPAQLEEAIAYVARTGL